MKKILVVGSGFAGAVIARELVNKIENLDIEVWDERDHTGGNCHTEIDKDTGIVIHKYGPHIFNTDSKEIWDYVNKFGKFNEFTNRVKAVTDNGVFSLPINLHTINQFYNKNYTPFEARLLFNSFSKDVDINNFEDQALNMVGKELYETFFKGYTKKQWGCHPTELPASILKRLPVRFNYNDNYYEKKYQGIPENGYSEIINNILDHKRIKVILNKKFHIEDINESYNHVFYSGPIDNFFKFNLGRLGYRTVTFEKIQTDLDDYQGNAVINYTSEKVPFTRIHEHKHFNPNKKYNGTIVFKEYSKETTENDIPYYPKRLEKDIKLLANYKNQAKQFNDEQTRNKEPRISFCGRLGTYRYLDMEKVISESIYFSEKSIQNIISNVDIPIFFES